MEAWEIMSEKHTFYGHFKGRVQLNKNVNVPKMQHNTLKILFRVFDVKLFGPFVLLSFCLVLLLSFFHL